MAVESPRPVRDSQYYLRETPLNGPLFFGKGAERLGIAGTFDRETYLSLFDGYTTKDGQRADRLPKYMHPERRGAFEITLNNPKDVSIAGEVGNDTRIDAVIERAKAAVAKYVEQNAVVRVKKKAEDTEYTVSPKGRRYVERKTDNLIMAYFDHPSNRMNDPHRHSHLVIMNMSHDPKEKTWKAIELKYLDKPKLSAIYRDEMRKGLHQLGYKTRQKGNEYEIVGTPSEAKAVFSRRLNEIKSIEKRLEAKKGSPLKAESRRKIGAYDRPEKSPNMPLAERRKGWLQRLSDAQRRGVHLLVSKARNAVKRYARFRQADEQTRRTYDYLRSIDKERTSVEKDIRGHAR